VEVAGVRLKVIHTPGHTPGGVSFYTNGVVFCGDTLFRGSIGRTDMPGGDYGQEMSSIVDRLLELPDDTIVLPGHMQETKIGIERQANPFVLEELGRRRGGGGRQPQRWVFWDSLVRGPWETGTRRVVVWGKEEVMISSIISALSAAVVHFEREGGQTLAEYGLILAFIAVASIIALGALGLVVSSQLDAIAAALP
jgi:Flp pilus assembly pilin Flp